MGAASLGLVALSDQELLVNFQLASEEKRNMSAEHGNYLSIPEGSLFWVSSAPTASPHSGIHARPPLLFIHAGIADHTLWDAQSQYLVQRGWRTIRYDLFGYGKSLPSEDYLRQDAWSNIKFYEHARLVLNAYHQARGTSPSQAKCIVIGLSRGGGYALDFALAYPNLVEGLVVCNGGVGGLPEPSPTDAESFFVLDFEEHLDNKDAAKAAQVDVEYWGEGFGRDVQKHPLDPAIRKRLYDWCVDIEQRTIDRRGGGALPEEQLASPLTAAEMLEQGLLTTKTAVAVGLYDELPTRDAMDFIIDKAKTCSRYTKRYAAHLINMETADTVDEQQGNTFNEWLEETIILMTERATT